MSTEVLAPLPIPEQVVVGTGTYVIPADRYGFLACSASHTASGTTGHTNNMVGGNGQGTSNSIHQWLTAGDTITVSGSNPSGTTNTNQTTTGSRETGGYHRININGIAVCVAYAGVTLLSYSNSNANHSLRTFHYGTYGWSVSLYRIPKANLPTGTAEGE